MGLFPNSEISSLDEMKKRIVNSVQTWWCWPDLVKKCKNYYKTFQKIKFQEEFFPFVWRVFKINWWNIQNVGDILPCDKIYWTRSIRQMPKFTDIYFIKNSFLKEASLSSLFLFFLVCSHFPKPSVLFEGNLLNVTMRTMETLSIIGGDLPYIL